MKEAIKNTKGFTDTESKVSKLVSHFKKSALATNRLKAACAQNGYSYKKLKTSIKIRWNSEYDSFERLLYHKDCIERMDNLRQLENVSDDVLNRNDWRCVETIMEVLKPVKIATKVLESETEPTINRVAEILFDLDEGLKKINEDNSKPIITRAFADNLKQSLQRKFPKYGLEETSFI